MWRYTGEEEMGEVLGDWGGGGKKNKEKGERGDLKTRRSQERMWPQMWGKSHKVKPKSLIADAFLCGLKPFSDRHFKFN